MLRRLLCALLLPALLCSSAAAAEKIVVATNPTWPPLEFLDDDKNIIGYDIDMIQAIGKEVGLDVEIRMIAWDGIFAGVAAGNYDVIASGVTITPERQRAFEFSKPYYDVQQIVVVKKGESAANFEALKGRTVGGQIGTTGVFVARKSGVDMTLREYDDVGLAMQDLINGRIDAVIADDPVAKFYANKREDFAGKFSVAYLHKDPEYFGFCVRKGRTEMLNRLNKAIAEIKADGTENKLKVEWMGTAD